MFQTMICRALSPGCAEQHHMRGDHCNPFRFIPDFMCLIKVYSEAAWHGVAYDGPVGGLHMMDLSLHGVQDVTAFQWVGSESETIYLRIPGAEEQPESPHRGKGHGLKYTAQILPPVEL